MDVKSDIENKIHSFPAKFGETATTRTTIQLTLLWFACFAISDPVSSIWFLGASALMASLNIYVVLSRERLKNFQSTLFQASMFTGWALLIALAIGLFL
jgi:4-hydroxybenzoate polyprenyltransferase